MKVDYKRHNQDSNDGFELHIYTKNNLIKETLFSKNNF